MRAANVMLIFAILVLSGFASVGYAHQDPGPDIDIVAYDSRGFVTDEEDTDVDVIIRAEDEGFNAGISSLQLFEGSRILGRKECFFALRCELAVSVHNELAGSRRYTGIVIDAGQNKKTDSLSVRFRGAEQPPELSFVNDVEVQENSRIEIKIQANDFDNDVPVIMAKGLPRGAVFSNSIFSWKPDFDQSGSYSIRFTASDDDGSTTETLKIKVVDVNQPPAVSFSERDTRFYMYEGDEHKFSVVISDPDKKNPSVEWKLDGSRVSTSKTYTYKPKFDDEGTHTLVAAVTDGPFVEREVWTIEVRDINREPDIRRVTEKEADEGEKVRFTLSATDKDGDVLIYSASDLPRGAAFNPAARVFEWQTREGDAGTYFVTFKVTDAKGLQATESAKIKVVRKFKTSHEKYHEFLRRWEEQRRNVTSGRQAFAAPSLTIQECREGYLCSVITYFFR